MLELFHLKNVKLVSGLLMCRPVVLQFSQWEKFTSILKNSFQHALNFSDTLLNWLLISFRDLQILWWHPFLVIPQFQWGGMLFSHITQLGTITWNQGMDAFETEPWDVELGSIRAPFELELISSFKEESLKGENRRLRVFTPSSYSSRIWSRSLQGMESRCRTQSK